MSTTRTAQDERDLLATVENAPTSPSNYSALPLNDRNETPTALPKPSVCETVCEPDTELAATAGHEPRRRPDGNRFVDEVISRALDRLDERRARVRDPQTGQWTIANGGRLKNGWRSDEFWQDIEPARQHIEERVRLQLALTDADAPEIALGTIEAYSEARLMRRSEFLQLGRLDDSPKNVKQRRQLRQRREEHKKAWALAFDRELRAGQLLGLERKARYVDPMDALKAAVREANR